MLDERGEQQQQQVVQGGDAASGQPSDEDGGDARGNGREPQASAENSDAGEAADVAAGPDSDSPDSGTEAAAGDAMAAVRERATEVARQRIDTEEVSRLSRRRLAQRVSEILDEVLAESDVQPDLLQQRDIVTAVLNDRLEAQREAAAEAGREKRKSLHDEGSEQPGPVAEESRSRQQSRVQTVKGQVQPLVMERIDIAVASRMEASELEAQIVDIVVEVLGELKIQLNATEQRGLVRILVDDMLGLGPLEPLLADESVTDIMVNGPNQVYVERGGKLEVTDVGFRDDSHVMNVATRIVTRVGRRIDESTPLVDARLHDGSRVNIIVPPLAIDGPSISIRKFAKKKITLEVMQRQGNVSEPLSTLLKIASRCRLNILISGGTGSGKTTLLNAMSRMIDHGERIVTIEDAAELQLQQPHVVRLETRPPSLEGAGEITMRDLVKNALRMRPDRIILGEVRGSEALDMLQAMNTGHDGSMCTTHANSPREALTRLENMVAMSGVQLPPRAVRTQIADAIHLVVQISRMRDGMRRVAQVSEVVGMEGDVITMQDLFWFEFQGEGHDGHLLGTFKCSGFRPNFTPRAEYFGLGDLLMETVECRTSVA